jgi:hypothetical protein
LRRLEKQSDVYELSIAAKLKGKDVSVFPDTGAAANFISLTVDTAGEHQKPLDFSEWFDCNKDRRCQEP